MKKTKIKYHVGLLLFIYFVILCLITFGCVPPKQFQYKDHYKHLHTPTQAEMNHIKKNKLWEKGHDERTARKGN